MVAVKMWPKRKMKLNPWLLSYLIIGSKVFMDARMPVTHKEGDRYPLGPPEQIVSKDAQRL